MGAFTTGSTVVSIYSEIFNWGSSKQYYIFFCVVQVLSFRETYIVILELEYN